MEEKVRQGLNLNKERGDDEMARMIARLEKTFPMLAEIIHEADSPCVWLVINNLEEVFRKDHVIKHASSDESLSNWRFEALVDVIVRK